MAKKSDSNNELRLETMIESPLKLVELRQRRTNVDSTSMTLSAGMHFKAPTKAAYSYADSKALENIGGTKNCRKTPASVETSSSTGESLTTKEFNKNCLEYSTSILKSRKNRPEQHVWHNPALNIGGSTKNGAYSTATDDSQHSSTSEYGSMADTHSSVSDSRLSSPQLPRNSSSRTPSDWQYQRTQKVNSNQTRQYHHEKSPSWPHMYFDGHTSSLSPTNSPTHYRTQSCLNAVDGMLSSPRDEDKGFSDRPVESGQQANYETHSSSIVVDSPSGHPSTIIGYGRGESTDSENAEGAGESGTLRRCSAQSMREICPQLLKKLQQPSTMTNQHSSIRQQPYSRASLRGWDVDDKGQPTNLYSTPGSVGGGGFMNDVSTEKDNRYLQRMHSKSPSQLSSSGSSNVSGNMTPKMEFRNFVNDSSYDISYETTISKCNDTKDEQSSSFRRSASSENVIRSYALVDIPHRLSNFHSSMAIGGDTMIRETDRNSDNAPFDVENEVSNKIENQNTKPTIRGRYQQKVNRNISNAKSSIRRKLQHVSNDANPTRSMPDLSANDQFTNLKNTEGNMENTKEKPVPKEPLQDPVAYATSQRLSSASFSSSTSPLYAIPYTYNNRGGHLERSLTMTKASPPPPPLPRKPPPLPPSQTNTTTTVVQENRVRHLRQASDCIVSQTTTSSNESGEQASVSVAMISRKFADQIRANQTSMSTSSMRTEISTNDTHHHMVNSKYFQHSNSVTTIPNQTTFPATPVNVNRRIVQVHPMCVAEISPVRQGQLSSSLSSSSASLSSSSNGQYSPPNHSSSHSTNDLGSTPMSIKQRPPVPKKPPKLSPPNSNTQQVPMRPPKPFSMDTNREHRNSNLDNSATIVDGISGDRFGGNSNQKEPFSNSAFKQRKRQDDEERCRELSNYVAQKSNDSSLKQILAPNQRCSVDYLEEYFANMNGFGDGRNDVEMAAKNIFYQNGQSGRLGSHPMRTASTESIDLEKEKIDLIARMSRKLKVLKEEQRAVEEEIQCNNDLGASLFALINDSTTLTKQAKDRFRQFVIDTENSTQLLLKLSCQLARMDNELNRLTQGNDKSIKDKQQQLMERRRQLMSQLHDAKELREDLDRRGEQITTVLKSVLTQDQLADYQYFIQMKHKLLLDGREIEDKIKLGEDQKRALELSLSK